MRMCVYVCEYIIYVCVCRCVHVHVYVCVCVVMCIIPACAHVFSGV